jgi:hydrogenase-4 component B
LAGLFLAIIALVALLATIYGIGYMRHYFGKYNIGSFYFFYNLFLGSMMLVVLANHALFFLIAWELMALASYFLVVFDHNDRENVQAGFLYFIITHIATLAIIILFFIFYRLTGSFDFDVWRNGHANISPLLGGIIFALTIVGFGTKAGIIPLHIWLPAAHPAAPSQVSALMSGVMIKTGIYMLIRVFFDFFGNTPQWFGLTVLLLGAISSILGVLYALGEHDIKRLLAYHSIENIGIILLGLGAALTFRSMGENMFALLALAATLFHTVNHAVFKSLLFMSAGSVVLSTHTRNIEEYGGLIKRMPETALFFLIGSIAISGLVPFNGFVSEWLTFQALFGGIYTMSVATKAIMIGGIAALAFTGGLAAACFVKAFGVTFLARPRSVEAEQAKEASSGMRISMAILALITLALGIFGGTMAKIFMNVAYTFPSLSRTFSPLSLYREELSLTDGFAQLHMPLLFVALLIALLVTWFISNLSKEKQKVAVGITWDCGFPLTKRMEITATAFSRSIVTIFGGLLRPEMHVERTYINTEKKHYVSSITVSGHLRDVYRIYVYDPIARTTLHLGRMVSKIQSGSTHMYLAYMMIVLVVLIYFATH